LRASASGDPGGVPAAREIQAAGRRLGRSRRGQPARARARPTEGGGGQRRAKRTDYQAKAGGGRPSRRPTAAAARRAACGCVSGSVSEGSNRPLGLYRYPHGLTLTLTVYCARHSTQRRHRTPIFDRVFFTGCMQFCMKVDTISIEFGHIGSHNR